MEHPLMLLWPWLTYILYWIGVSLLIIVIFAIGYSAALNKLQAKKVAAAPVDLDSKLDDLKREIDGAKMAIDRLLKKTGLSSAEAGSRLMITGRYVVPGERRRLSQTISRMGRLLHLGSKPKEADGNPLAVRLQESQDKIKGITSDVERVIQSLNAGIHQRNDSRRSAQLPGEPLEAAESMEDDSQNEFSSLFHPDSSPEGKTPDASVPLIVRHRNADEEQGSAGRVARMPASTNVPGQIIDLYNRAVTDNFAREQFREQYQPLRVGTVNAVERTRNPNIDAEFRETTDGIFFALAIPGKNEYAVVPRLGVTIEAVSFNAGAVGEVFDCPGYEAGLFYSRYRVRQPATFKRDGERWELLKRGALDLGPND